MPDEEPRTKRAVTSEDVKKPLFTEKQGMMVGGLGGAMVLGDIYPTYGKLIMAAGFLMYFNAAGFI